MPVMTYEPCMCGDTECPVCGVLQGTYGGVDVDDPWEIDEPEMEDDK